MGTQNEIKAKKNKKKFIQKVMEHLNPVLKTDEDFTKYATSQWIGLLASKSNLCSSDLDKFEELIKGIIQSTMQWKDEQHAKEKQKLIEKACEQFKILINFFDNNKEFNADKFCEKWKKDIEKEL